MIREIQNYPLSKDDIIKLLTSEGREKEELFNYSAEVKRKIVGNKVYLRGLIELSNICKKDCCYCGIRKSNHKIKRYILTEEEVIRTIKKAYEEGYGSVAIQSGEQSSKSFTDKINRILQSTKQITNNNIGITLSCGEQSKETYRRWYESGADRYLLRVETSSESLYKRLHPNDNKHSFSRRIKALELLKVAGYQVGTGVMIGLPFQTKKNLADDLLFMKSIDIDMCGMGPYIEHSDTPLNSIQNQLLTKEERFNLSLKMVSLLRLLMPDINIAATTALQTLKCNGREMAIKVGANVIMPNITPGLYKENYLLYENKPVSIKSDEDELNILELKLEEVDNNICYFSQGNSKHYFNRIYNSD